MTLRALLLLLLSAALPLRAQSVATLQEVRGEVRYRAAGAQASTPAKAGQTLRMGDYLSTDFDSEATIGFPDGSQVKMSQMSQVRVNSLFQSAERSRLQLFLRLGQVETVAPTNPTTPTDFSVATPTATASIRGTHQLVEYTEGFGTRVQFLEGHGFTRSPGGRFVEQALGREARVGARGELTGPEGLAKEDSVPDFSPNGRDDTERGASRDYNRLTGFPPQDPASPTVVRNGSASGVPAGDLHFTIRRVP